MKKKNTVSTQYQSLVCRKIFFTVSRMTKHMIKLFPRSINHDNKSEREREREKKKKKNIRHMLRQDRA